MSEQQTELARRLLAYGMSAGAVDDLFGEAVRLVAEGRCVSCEHGQDIHDVDGLCWFTVAQGTPGKNLVCPCHVRESQVL